MSNFKICIFLYSLMYCVVLCGCSKQQDQAKTSSPQATQQAPLPTTSLEKQLFESINNHDETTVKQLIAQGVNVNAHEEEDGKYIAGGFMLNGSAVDFAGGKVFENTSYGNYPSSVAECMNSTDEDAIKSKNILWALIGAGAALDGCEHLIREIVESGDMPFVELLLKKGVDFKKYKGILHNATKSENTDVFKLILTYDKDIECRFCFDNDTVLMHAVNNEIIVRTLLEMGADVNQRNDCGRTAFTGAVREGNETIVKLLMDHGADIHTRADNNLNVFAGENALMQAVLGGHTNIVKLLLEKGINIEERDDNGKTALHWAAGGVSLGWRNVANPDMTRFLLQNGAQVNAQDNQGRTPLHDAMAEGMYTDEKTILTLVQFGANVSIKDHDGKTPLDYLDQEQLDITPEDAKSKYAKILDILNNPHQSTYLAPPQKCDA